MKKCPFCGNEIQDVAIKCKHCKKWIQESTETPSVAPLKKIENKKIFYIVGGLALFLILTFITLSLRYEVADYERFRYRYDRFTNTVERAGIAALTSPTGANKPDLWRKTRYVSLQQAISEEQRKTREEAVEAQRQSAYEQRRAIEDAVEAQDQAADEQRWAIEDAAEDQRQAADQQRWAIEDQKRAMARQKSDAEFEKLLRRK